MKSGIRAYARFLGAAFASNVKSALEYRANFLLQFFGMILNNAAFALFWDFLLRRTGSLGGYGFREIMYVWALTSSAFGLAHAVFGNLRAIGGLVREGGLDAYLLQPKDAFLNVLVSKTMVSAWGDFLYGYIVLFLLPGCSAASVLLFTALVVPAAVVLASVFAAADSSAFFVGDSGGLSQAVFEFMLSFSLYPETIFGPGFRWVLYSILPSAFVAFVPARALAALDWGAVLPLCAVAALYAALAYAVFRAGLKRYGSGNRMDARI